MIIDNIQNSSIYYGVQSGFRDAFAFIKKYISSPLPVGKYEIDGSRVFAMVQEYEPKTENRFEAHRKYIDIQFIISGREKMLCGNIDSYETQESYDADKDVEFFKGDKFLTSITADPGTFAIFFPEDVHKPGLIIDEGKNVQKIVVKVEM